MILFWMTLCWGKFSSLFKKNWCLFLFSSIAQYLNLPVVAFNTAGASSWSDEMVRNPVNPAYNPNMLYGFNDKMNFFQILVNTALTLIDQIAYQWDQQNYELINAKLIPQQLLLPSISRRTLPGIFQRLNPQPEAKSHRFDSQCQSCSLKLSFTDSVSACTYSKQRRRRWGSH